MSASNPAVSAATRVHYHDDVVVAFIVASVIWALFGMLAGVWVAAELVWPQLNLDSPLISFGRLRTVHTNAVLFGFAISALMATSFTVSNAPAMYRCSQANSRGGFSSPGRQ